MRTQDGQETWSAQAAARAVSLYATTTYNRYRLKARGPPSEHNTVPFRGFNGPRSRPTTHKSVGGAFLCACDPFPGLPQ